MTNIHDYSDIINLKRPVSKKHPKMKTSDRAAQFAPFAALTGYDAAVRETARHTTEKHELCENALELLDYKLEKLRERIAEMPELCITYFRPDNKKEGGEYVDVHGRVFKVDEFKKALIMSDGSEININMIAEIEGKIFYE